MILAEIMIAENLLPVYEFLKETGIGRKDYCLFTNPFIGQRVGLAPKTVGDHLRDLEALGIIRRFNGPPPGSFEPGAKRVRRIYWANHPALSEIKADAPLVEKGFEETPDGLTFWRRRYADASGDPLVPWSVRQSRSVPPVAKLLLFEITSIFGSDPGDAPLGYYSWGLGLPLQEVEEAFSFLRESGIVWYWEKAGRIRYGLTRDLFRTWFYYSTVEIDEAIVARAELIFRESSIFGSVAKYRAAIKEGQAEPPGQIWPSE